VKRFRKLRKSNRFAWWGMRLTATLIKNTKPIWLNGWLIAGFLNLGCWNQFQGVLGKVTYVAVKGLSMGFPLFSYCFCQCYCHNCCFCFGEWTKHMIKMYCTCLYLYSNQVLANGRGAGLLRRHQKWCWGRKRLRNAGL